MSIDFARRAEAIRSEMLALDLSRRPRVCLLILADAGAEGTDGADGADGAQGALGAGQISGHRVPVDIELPGDEVVPSHFVQAATPAQHDAFRRRLAAAVLRAGADLVARTVANLAAAGEGVNIVDARLVVTYRDAEPADAEPAGVGS